MTKKVFTNADAKAELVRAKNISASRASAIKSARKIVKHFESEEVIDEADLKSMVARLRKDEVAIARMLKPVSKLGKNPR